LFARDGDRLTLTTECNKSTIDGSEGFGELEFERIKFLVRGRLTAPPLAGMALDF
jgi:hypothetical protein